jgi:hypothetical protein
MNFPSAIAGVLAIAMNCLPASAQFIISAKAGLINHIEGEVLLAGAPIFETPGAYPKIRPATTLSTEEGRAEVLLNPGLFLRIGENSAVRMVSNVLAKTKIEFLAGAAVIEPAGPKDKTNWASAVTIAFKDAVVYLRRNGTYRFDAEPPQLRVYSGEAAVRRGAVTHMVNAGALISLANPGPLEEFDLDATDSLAAWSMRRTEVMSTANEAAARQKKLEAISHAGVWPRALINSR